MFFEDYAFDRGCVKKKTWMRGINSKRGVLRALPLMELQLDEAESKRDEPPASNRFILLIAHGFPGKICSIAVFTE